MKMANLLILAMIFLPSVSAAHWIVGYVEDAADSTSPNGRTLSVQKTSDLNEVFGIIGPTGMSGTSNVYMVDCELMSTPCAVGDLLNISIVPNGSPYNSPQDVQVTVTGAGFDIAPNLTMTTPFYVTNVTVDDQFTSPQNELDLAVNSTINVTCTGVVETYSGIDSVENISSVFYSSSSSKLAPDDNNNHYSNSSCSFNISYGTPQQGLASCTFEVEYYAMPGTWTCQINATDNSSQSAIDSDTTSMNKLLAIGLNSTLNFSTVDQTSFSDEIVMEIINLGNTMINLSLSGYGQAPGDGYSMICTSENISIENAKYNISSSNPGQITLPQSENFYRNLTATGTIEAYKLNSRQNDLTNDALNNTYWRMYVPRGPRETCQGNIVVGATES